MEEQATYDQIDFKFHWFDTTTTTSKGIKNFTAFNKDIDTLLCPSTENRPNTYTTDYNVMTRIDQDSYCAATASGGVDAGAAQKRAVEKLVGMLTDQQGSIRKVSDGTSHTIMFVESAGRPNHYTKGKTLKNLMWEENTALKQPGVGDGLTDYQWGDGGYSGGNTPANEGYDGLPIVWNRKTTPPGPMPTDIATVCPMNTAVMNCDNYKGVYSFHSGGCNIVFGDGSVQFIKEDISADAFVSLITRGAEDPTPTDY